ncbi:putative lipoprotein YiaD [Pedobacter glucosidilyticus]|nr:OmpA family protein [Pedobacter glucosidilyticus]KHJ37706.1 putative lipoprotein YiaD [Pedobacter glucosidilyticus]
MRFLCCFLLLSISILCFGQDKYSSKDKTAIRSYEKASYFLDLNRFTEAKVELNYAIKQDDQFIEAYLLLADVYRVTFDLVNAKLTYRKAFAIHPDFAPERYFYLAECEIKTGDYKEAIIHLNHYLSKAKPQEAKRLALTNKYLKDCDFALLALKNPVSFKPENLGPSVNTSDQEYLAALTTDENTLIFTRQINNNEDFYIAKKKNANWEKANYLSTNINTPNYNEGAQCISPDGQFLFFTGCNRPDGLGRCDIYVSQREGDGWSKPINLGNPINTKGWESQPSISADGRTLYFVSDREDGFGSYDIWKSELTDDGKWGNPINLGSKINTPYDEQSPFIHPDNETLYFSSNGWVGFGNKDIFISRLDKSGNWSDAQNLGYPINTYGEESGLTINASGNKAFFSSNNFNGFGGFDIYSFDLPNALKPKAVNYVKGKVYDAQTQQPLDAVVDIIDLRTENSLYASYANKVDGTFMATLPHDKLYSLNVSKKGYLFYSESFSVDHHKPGEPVFLDVPLHKIAVGNKVILRNIFFDSNKFNIKTESKVELEKLIEFLTENPKVVIEIRGFTDDIGDNQSNLLLSQNRSKSVYSYLLTAGINENRIKYKGFGESNPIADNLTPEGRASNRRTEFVITEIRETIK